jgi:hypothetical protein
MEGACLAAASVPDVMLDLWKIRRRKDEALESSPEEASEETKETLTCAICLGSIETFSSACCMSCVCEGVFHRECLECVPKVAPHALQADRRQCPYCRTEGTIVELHKEVHRMCPPGNKRERIEKRVRQMYTLTSSTRDDLEKAEREIRRRTLVLGDQVNELRRLPGGDLLVESLLYPPLQPELWRSPKGKTFCRSCGEGILSFSELSTQACHCSSLYHDKCLQKIVDGAPMEKIMCCPCCRNLGIVQEGVSVKELVSTACLSSPRGESLDKMRKEASDVQAGQMRFLAQLGGHMERVASKLGSVWKRDASSLHGPLKRRKTQLAYLPA